MTTNEIINLPSAAHPDRLGQATAVEQSRAVAQVQAAVVMARQFPRSQQRAITEMEEACGRMELASRAFFKFPRGRETVTGASVYLARELARIWGNVEYGLNELRRDDVHGQSEMQAYAWDMETNARSARVFIVEHARDTRRDGRVKLTELRDISDNNNNLGARAVREMIYAVLPQWFTDKAQAICRETQNNGGGVPLVERRARAIKGFGQARITQAELEAHVGASVDEWTHADVSDLENLYRSLAAKEITRDEAFPPQRVDAEELAGPKAPASPSKPAPEQPTDQPAFPEQETPWVNPVTGEVKP